MTHEVKRPKYKITWWAMNHMANRNHDYENFKIQDIKTNLKQNHKTDVAYAPSKGSSWRPNGTPIPKTKTTKSPGGWRRSIGDHGDLGGGTKVQAHEEEEDLNSQCFRLWNTGWDNRLWSSERDHGGSGSHGRVMPVAWSTESSWMASVTIAWGRESSWTASVDIIEQCKEFRRRHSQRGCSSRCRLWRSCSSCYYLEEVYVAHTHRIMVATPGNTLDREMIPGTTGLGLDTTGLHPGITEFDLLVACTDLSCGFITPTGSPVLHKTNPVAGEILFGPSSASAA